MADAAPAAVFLSYASQDAPAVLRMAEALRAAGVEVWFDQNELVGGDAWDQKIRKQIKDCALFVPVISANTQARTEGYFRLEWRLADQRTHLMAKGRPFLLPVVIDDTRDAEAHVPDSFTEVQWTHLRQGSGGQARLSDVEALDKFCARVKKLLSGEVAPVSDRRADVGARLVRAQEEGRGQATPLQKASRPWLVPAIIGAAVLAVLALWQPWRAKEKSSPAASTTGAPAAPISEARKLAAKADAMFDQLENASHEDLLTAEQLLKQALALDQNDPEIWAIYSRLCVNLLGQQFELSEERVALAGNAADRAVRLAPQSFEARLALANFYRLGRGPQSMVEEAERTLRELVALQPTNKRAWRILGLTLRGNTGSTEGRRLGRYDEAVSYYDRAASLPGGDPLALHNKAQLLMVMGRSEEAEATIDQVLALHPNGSSYLVKVTLLLIGRGDWRQAKELLAKVPVSWLREDTGAAIAYQVWHCAREADKALEALRAVPRDYIQASMSWGPKAFLAGQAQRLAKRDAAAQVEWRAALQLVDGRLAKNQNEVILLRLKARLLACLEESGEAERALRTVEQLAGGNAGEITLDTALIYLELGKREEVIAWLPTELAKPWNFALPITRAYLRINPQWDALRNDPRFQALIASAPAPEEKKENKPTSATPAPAANEKSLVVLPLENLSPDPENAFFTDGMHAEIISTLSQIADLKVTPRQSALAFKGSTAALAEIAQKLGVANVLTGSVRRAGNTVRIQLELRRASDEALLWSLPNGNRELKDVLGLQSEVADQVSRVLQARADKGIYAGAQLMTKDAQVYDLYLKAMNLYLTSRGVSEAEEVIRMMDVALQREPKFMLAAKLMARAHSRAAQLTHDLSARISHAAEAKKWA